MTLTDEDYMTQQELLLAIRKIYPGPSVTIRIADSENYCLIRLNRHDPFEDGLSSFYPYRVVVPNQNTIIAHYDSEAVIEQVKLLGFEDSAIDLGLDDTLIDMLMIQEAKNELIDKLIKPSMGEEVLSRAKNKRAVIESGFAAVKHDTDQLKEFITKLATGEDLGPSLSVVKTEDTDD